MVRRSEFVALLRFIPALLGFVFSLLYSKLMGIDNRSFLTFILLVNTILAFLLLSGLGLRVRNCESFKEVNSIFLAFLSFSLVVSLAITTALMITVIVVTSQFKVFSNLVIPNNALIAIAIYSLLSALSIPFFDLLSTLQSFRAFLMIEILVIITQIVVFALLIILDQTTYFVSTLLAYSISYSFLIFSTVVVLLSNSQFSFKVQNSFKLLFKRETANLFSLSFLNNLVERFDKILIPFNYASPQLAQITIFTNALSIFRVIPETFIRFKQQRNLNNLSELHNEDEHLKKMSFVLIFPSILLIYVFVYLALGKEWLLPLPVIGLLAIYELLVWRSKELMVGRHTASSKRSVILNTSLGFFYLLPLPVLMGQYDYLVVLTIMICTLLVWIKLFDSRRRKHLKSP